LMLFTTNRRCFVGLKPSSAWQFMGCT